MSRWCQDILFLSVKNDYWLTCPTSAGVTDVNMVSENFREIYTFCPWNVSKKLLSLAPSKTRSQKQCTAFSPPSWLRALRNTQSVLNRKSFFSLQLTNATPRNFRGFAFLWRCVWRPRHPGTSPGQAPAEVTSAGRHFGMDEMSKKVAEIYTKFPWRVSKTLLILAPSKTRSQKTMYCILAALLIKSFKKYAKRA